MRTGIVIGLGETGGPLYEILKDAYPDTLGHDPKYPDITFDLEPCDYLHICIPYSDKFLEIVSAYQDKFTPLVTIIHSTVPIGTTVLIENAVHSPIRGRHGRMKEDLYKYTKWIGGAATDSQLCKYFRRAGFEVRVTRTSGDTEALKLICLAKYGNSLSFAQYVKSEFDEEVYANSLIWDREYNENVGTELQRPIFHKLSDKIGGHCVTQNTKILNESHPNPMLAEVLKHAECGESTTTVWPPSNIYPTAKIGKNVSIGAFCEIGDNVVIGDNVRIGAYTFIPQGVVIEDDAWIGPRVTFSNDMYPPSGGENWETTLIKRGARLGAAVCVRPNVIIGEKALVGMGAVVTCDIPPGETWVGVPATKVYKVEAAQESEEGFCATYNRT